MENEIRALLKALNLSPEIQEGLNLRAGDEIPWYVKILTAIGSALAVLFLTFFVTLFFNQKDGLFLAGLFFVILSTLISRKEKENLSIGGDTFFFQEGQGEAFSSAAYGGMRISPGGTAILAGLYDEHFKKIIPPEVSIPRENEENQLRPPEKPIFPDEDETGQNLPEKPPTE